MRLSSKYTIYTIQTKQKQHLWWILTLWLHTRSLFCTHGFPPHISFFEGICAFLTDIGRLFQIIGQEYDKLFRKISKFGLGMYRVESDEDLKFTWWMVFVYVNLLLMYVGARLCSALCIMTSLRKLTLSSNLLQPNCLKSLFDGVSTSLSRITLAARFWNLMTLSVSVVLQFPQIVLQ